MSNLSYIKDALNREVETYTLDIQDRPVSISNVESQTMNVAYGVGDMVKSVTRFDGTTVSNAYDGQARLIQQTLPGQTNTFGYTAAGKLKTIANRRCFPDSVYTHSFAATRLGITPVVADPPCDASSARDPLILCAYPASSSTLRSVTPPAIPSGLRPSGQGTRQPSHR